MKKLTVALTALSATMLAAVNAFALPVVDYAAIGTAISGELTPALASVIPITGTIIAIGVGIKMVKKFTGH